MKIFNKNKIYKERLTRGEKINLWVSRIFIWIVILITLFPVFSVVTASMNKGDVFFSTSILPKEWTLVNYTKVIKDTDFLVWVKNSLILCTSVSVIQIIMTAFAAYAFGRMKFVGRKNGLMTLLILQMFPNMMALPAILGIAYKYHFMDQMWGLVILLAGGNAFNIWLLKGYLDSIPKELDEAAMVDGASYWKVFTKIILPLSRPMIAVIFLFSFIGVYSEFIFTSALMKAREHQTLATGLKTFIENQFSAHWTQYSAAAIMASLPIMIIFMLLQKYIAKGLTAGAVKG